jgi:hypothetical protein
MGLRCCPVLVSTCPSLLVPMYTQICFTTGVKLGEAHLQRALSDSDMYDFCADLLPLYLQQKVSARAMAKYHDVFESVLSRGVLEAPSTDLLSAGECDVEGSEVSSDADDIGGNSEVDIGSGVAGVRDEDGSDVVSLADSHFSGDVSAGEGPPDYKVTVDTGLQLLSFHCLWCSTFLRSVSLLFLTWSRY